MPSKPQAMAAILIAILVLAAFSLLRAMLSAMKFLSPIVNPHLKVILSLKEKEMEFFGQPAMGTLTETSILAVTMNTTEFLTALQNSIEMENSTVTSMATSVHEVAAVVMEMVTGVSEMVMAMHEMEIAADEMATAVP